MKKIKSYFIALAATPIFLLSCQSTSKSAPVTSDSYDGVVIENTNQTASDKIETKKEEKNDSFFKYGNKGDYTTITESTCFSKNSFGVMGQKDASIVIYNKDRTAGIASSYQGVYYISLYDTDSRTKLINAYKKYLSDFDEKKLDRKGSKTYKAYGTATVTLRWGTLSNSTPNFGSGKVNFGYEFQDGSPYFTITVFPLTNDYFEIAGDTVRRESLLYKIYFTKAQAKQFTDNITSSIINSYFEEVDRIQVEKDAITADEY